MRLRDLIARLLGRDEGASLDVLLDARARLADPDRWTQADYVHGGRCCLVASVLLARGEDPIWDSDDCPETRLLARIVGVEPDDLTEWQDHPDRSHADVRRVLDRAVYRAGGCRA